MKSLKVVAIAAVMSWVALNGEEASAQVYYGYPTAVPLNQSYVPTSPRCRYAVPGAYGNNRAYPAGVPSSLYPSSSIPSGQYGWPAYSYPYSGYGAPVLTQPAGSYGAPVYYRPGATPYSVPVNSPVFPGAGHFSVEDQFTAPAPYGLSPGTLPAPVTNSPFYDTPGTIMPTGGYAPAGSYPTSPVISAPTNNSPFYP